MYPSSFSPGVQDVLSSYGRCTPRPEPGVKSGCSPFPVGGTLPRLCRRVPVPSRLFKKTRFSVHGNDFTGDLLLVRPHRAYTHVGLSRHAWSLACQHTSRSSSASRGCNQASLGGPPSAAKENRRSGTTHSPSTLGTMDEFTTRTLSVRPYALSRYRHVPLGTSRSRLWNTALENPLFQLEQFVWGRGTWAWNRESTRRARNYPVRRALPRLCHVACDSHWSLPKSSILCTR